MATRPQSSAPKFRETDPRNNPEAIVFQGDGEPHTPESTLERLSELLAQNQLHPDSYSLGGSVQEFEERMADELGKEAAIWLPTGTLANHLALRRHCGTSARVALQEQSHIYQDSGDTLSSLSGINAIPLAPGRPHFTTDDIQRLFDQSRNGRVMNKVSAVSIESPVRRQAGQIVPWDELKSITRLCREQGVPTHLDGARLYMMSAATGIGVKEYAELFDSVYVSSYKYFGAPFGGILAGGREFIEGMHHDRRMFGGGIPYGYLAAALSLAGLDDFESKFAEAFAKTEALFTEITEISGISVSKFEHGSNIFELILDSSIDTDQFISNLLESGIVLNWPNSEWHVPLLHVNTTVMRRSNSDIAQAFSDAAAVS